MIHQIKWTPEAEITFDNNLRYLEKEWGLVIINDFLDRVEDILNKISTNPKSFLYHRKKDVIHKCVHTQHITIYYKVNASSVMLLTFWNNYQNPKKLKLTNLK